MSEALDKKLLLCVQKAHTTEDRVLPEILGLLKRGADPNSTIEVPHNFECVMGISVRQCWPRVIESLITAGGKVVWPKDHSEISNYRLTGSNEDEAYKGFACDPLVLAFDGLEWAIEEYDPGSESASEERAKIIVFRDISKLLLSHQAPIERMDPAICRTPLEHFFTGLRDYSYDLLDSFSNEVVADVLIHVLDQQDDATLHMKAILENRWGDLPLFYKDWHKDQPGFLTHMVRFAEQRVLQDNTPLKPHRPSNTRL